MPVVIPSPLSNSPAGTIGWPGMNTTVQFYIDLANQRISEINTANPALGTQLNSLWNEIGTQLKKEQRARETALYPLPDPKNTRQPLSLSPTTIITWVDSITYYAQNTKPHMYAQTIEAIANWTTVGGQSIVGLMRQERNDARLTQAGITLDNNIPVTDQSITQKEDKTLIANGPTTSTDINGIPTATGGIPATLLIGPTEIGADPVANTAGAPTGNLGLGSNKLGYYDPSIDKYVITSDPYKTDQSTSITAASTNNAGTNSNIGGNNNSANTNTNNGTNGNNISITQSLSNSSNNNVILLPIVDTGTPVVPGSFAGGEYSDLIDPALNNIFISNQLTPSTYTVDEAVVEIEKCNCDCWDQ